MIADSQEQLIIGNLNLWRIYEDLSISEARVLKSLAQIEALIKAILISTKDLSNIDENTRILQNTQTNYDSTLLHSNHPNYSSEIVNILLDTNIRTTQKRDRPDF